MSSVHKSHRTTNTLTSEGTTQNQNTSSEDIYVIQNGEHVKFKTGEKTKGLIIG